ncbi:MAG: hypothetical protein Q9183_004015, partial [Haloplaca sp. 2 TL-2023]
MTVDVSAKEKKNDQVADPPKSNEEVAVAEHDTLKYHLLGPSLTKAGQDAVDQQK